MPSSLKANSMVTNNMAARSRHYNRSNEILVVEEVNDNELDSEAFKRMRESTNPIVSSMHTNSLSSGKMGPLIDDDQLP